MEEGAVEGGQRREQGYRGEDMSRYEATTRNCEGEGVRKGRRESELREQRE